jgi:hypothetical protein
MSARFGHLLVRGALRDIGYSADLSEKERQRVLDKSVKEYGGLSTFRKLNSLYILNKNRNPGLARKFRRDANYVKRKYYNTKQWESKITISQRAREKLAKAGKLTVHTIKKLKRAVKLDPDPKKMRVRKGYIGHRDIKGQGLIRVIHFKTEPTIVPEFALYFSKRRRGFIEPALMKAKFIKEEDDKWVLRTNNYNIFVYFY